MSWNDNFNPIYLAIKNRIRNEVRSELRHVSDRKLRSIVRAYKKLPFIYKHFNLPCTDEELQYRRDLRYGTARALLLGDFNWKKLEVIEREDELKKELDKLEKNKLEEYRKKQILTFPGSLEEFEKFTGEKYEIIDCYEEYSNQYRILDRLGRKGVEAFVRYRGDRHGDILGYGVPVRKVKGQI